MTDKILFKGFELSKEAYEQVLDSDFIEHPDNEYTHVVLAKIKSIVLSTISMLDVIIDECDYSPDSSSSATKVLAYTFFKNPLIAIALDNDLVVTQQLEEICSSVSDEHKDIIVHNILLTCLESVNLLAYSLMH